MTEFIVYTKPISVNQAYRRLKKYGMYLTAEAQAYKDTVAWAAKSEGRIHEEPTVYICFTFGDKKKHDLDNYLKLTLDACNGILWEDDSHIQELIITKRYEKNNPSIYLKVT